jgi:hypothetical protein
MTLADDCFLFMSDHENPSSFALPCICDDKIQTFPTLSSARLRMLLIEMISSAVPDKKGSVGHVAFH